MYLYWLYKKSHTRTYDTIKLAIVLSLALLFCLCANGQSSVVITRVGVIRKVMNAAEQSNIPKELLFAVCFVESNYKIVPPKIDGRTPSYGICQIKLETAQLMDRVYKHRVKVTATRLQDDFTNAFYAAKYLKYQLKRYKGDWKKAIDAYNKGHHVSSNSMYVKRVYVAMGY